MGKKILLADDSITIQKVIELTFSDEDFDVVTVGNGRLAIEKVQEARPDLVLCDIIMPEKDGYEVCEFIKSEPSLSHIPVLLLTGAFEPFDQERAARVGCDGFLAKPFEPQSLIQRVKDLLSQAGKRPAPTAAPRPAPAAPPPPAPAAPAPPPAPAPEPEPAYMADDTGFGEPAVAEFEGEAVAAEEGAEPAADTSAFEDTGFGEPVYAEADETEAAAAPAFGEDAYEPPQPSASDEGSAGFEEASPGFEEAPLASAEAYADAAPFADDGLEYEAPSVAETAAAEPPPAEPEFGAAGMDELYAMEPPPAEAAPAPPVDEAWAEEPAPAPVAAAPAASDEPDTSGFYASGSAPWAEPTVEVPLETRAQASKEALEYDDVFQEERPLAPHAEEPPPAMAEAPDPEPPPAPVDELSMDAMGELDAPPPPAASSQPVDPEPQLAEPQLAEPPPPEEAGPEAFEEPPTPAARPPAGPPPPAPLAVQSFADVAPREPAPPPAPASQAAELPVPVDMVEKIAQRVVAQISEKVIREIAWEVIPDLAEALIKKEIERLKSELQQQG